MQISKTRISFDDLISEVMKSDVGIEQLIKKEILKNLDNELVSSKEEITNINLNAFVESRIEKIKDKWMKNITLSNEEKEIYFNIVDKIEEFNLEINNEIKKKEKTNWILHILGAIIVIISFVLSMKLPNIFNQNFFILFFAIGISLAIKGGLFIAETNNLKENNLRKKLKEYCESLKLDNFNYTKFKLAKVEHKNSASLTDKNKIKEISKIILDMSDNENSSNLDHIVEKLLTT